jgi:hypothetical protein
MASNTTSRMEVPQAKDAMNRFKMEVVLWSSLFVTLLAN